MDENQNNENQTNEAPQGDAGMEQSTPPQVDAQPTPEPIPATKKSYGPIVGIIIIVVLIILAGFYFWGGSLENTENPQVNDTIEEVVEENGNAAGTVPAGSEGADTFNDTPGTSVGAPLSESDTIEDLETELLGTELDGLDAELGDIDAELAI